MTFSSDCGRPLVSLSSDFGIQSEGVGIMKGVVLSLCPSANVIDLTHGIESFSLIDAAREMETVSYLPSGIHVCVVDPGVGTKRHALVIEAVRGDFLIGPDNGVLVPAMTMLGGIKSAWVIRSTGFINIQNSRTFGGRDIFSRAAGWLALGRSCADLASEIPCEQLHKAPYDEAELCDGTLRAKVIHINKFGSAILNIRESRLDDIGVVEGKSFSIEFESENPLTIERVRSFAATEIGKSILVPDDYGRVELAINQGNFASTHGLSLGTELLLHFKV